MTAVAVHVYEAGCHCTACELDRKYARPWPLCTLHRVVAVRWLPGWTYCEGVGWHETR